MLLNQRCHYELADRTEELELVLLGFLDGKYEAWKGYILCQLCCGFERLVTKRQQMKSTVLNWNKHRACMNPLLSSPEKILALEVSK